MDDDALFLAALESLLADEETEYQAGRARSLAMLTAAGEHLAAIAADPGPLTAHGEIVRDTTGRPVPDHRVRARAARALHEVNHAAAAMTA